MSSDIAISYRRISKAFPGVQALRDVSLDIRRGACHALCGENGAGKSTLGKITAGICRPDEGEFSLFGRTLHLHSPRQAREAGIVMVHQELALCENMTVAENLCLGDLPSAGPFVGRRALQRRALSILALMDLEIDPAQKVAELSLAARQMLEIAAAISRDAKIVVFDEATSALSHKESERLFEIIRKIRAAGVTVIYVSHRLDELFALCDCVTVLRDGRHIDTRAVENLDRDALIRLMAGQSSAGGEAAAGAGRRKRPAAHEILRVSNFSSPGKFEDINFSINTGEVVGLAGIAGSGRTELAQALFGLDSRASGEVRLNGRPVGLGGVRTALRVGIGLVPEDRKRNGLVLSMTPWANITLASLGWFSRWGWVIQTKEYRAGAGAARRLRIRGADRAATCASLSGGNQQKIVFAKWLLRNLKVLILDEPTRGVDVTAKQEVHKICRDLAGEGLALLLISSDMAELLELSDRLVVLNGGRQTTILAAENLSQQALLSHMIGGR